MTTMSPAATCSAGTVTSWPFLMITAVLGARSTSFPRASEVFDLDLASRYFPTVTSVRIMAADSKYRAWAYSWTTAMFWCPKPQAMRYMAKRPYTREAPDPIATRESILGARFTRAFSPTL